MEGFLEGSTCSSAMECPVPMQRQSSLVVKQQLVVKGEGMRWDGPEFGPEAGNWLIFWLHLGSETKRG